MDRNFKLFWRIYIILIKNKWRNNNLLFKIYVNTVVHWTAQSHGIHLDYLLGIDISEGRPHYGAWTQLNSYSTMMFRPIIFRCCYVLCLLHGRRMTLSIWFKMTLFIKSYISSLGLLSGDLGGQIMLWNYSKCF